MKCVIGTEFIKKMNYLHKIMIDQEQGLLDKHLSWSPQHILWVASLKQCISIIFLYMFNINLNTFW